MATGIFPVFIYKGEPLAGFILGVDALYPNIKGIQRYVFKLRKILCIGLVGPVVRLNIRGDKGCLKPHSPAENFYPPLSS